MAKPTPFHDATHPLATSWAYKVWNGFASVCSFNGYSEEEYFAIRHKAAVFDVSPLCKADLIGPDAAALLTRCFSRDITKLARGRMTYGVLINAAGKVLDDGTVARIGPEHYRLATSERWGAWLRSFSDGLQVEITDETDNLAVLAVQGPLAREALEGVVAFDLQKMRLFRMRPTQLAGCDGWVSRSGYTGDLGFELWMRPSDALEVWAALMEAGEKVQLTPAGLDALDVSRIEAGFILPGVDYYGARGCMIEHRKSSPFEIGLGETVDLERSIPLLAQERLEREAAEGSPWKLVGLELDWEAIERLHDEAGIPPHLAPVACRASVPIYGRDNNTVVGQMTSSTWSPLLKRYLGLATIRSGHAGLGETVRVEYTIEYVRKTVRAKVVPTPFFDPPRRRAVPAKEQA